MANKFIQKIGIKKGALHKALGVQMGQPIPMAKLDKALHSDNPHIKKMAVLARTLKGLRK